jgi:DNA-binding response OmpR family regulator
MDIRVLMADPDQGLLESYHDFLVREGFEVCVASNGPACQDMLHDWKPDVLVLEPDMPDGWGERILKGISQQSEMQRIRVIVLSRRDGGDITPPVCQYHVKPIPLAELAASIQTVASRQTAPTC